MSHWRKPRGKAAHALSARLAPFCAAALIIACWAAAWALGRAFS